MYDNTVRMLNLMLQGRKLTGRQIRQEVGAANAPDIVFDARRHGVEIQSEMIEVPTRHKKTARVAEYTLITGPDETRELMSKHGDLGALDTCFCVGPQDGLPCCPCRMKDVHVRSGRYVEFRDLGPVPQHLRTDVPDPSQPGMFS